MNRMDTQHVFFSVAGVILAEADAEPTDTNVARALVAATEEFKRGCSNNEQPHTEPWQCSSCTEAYLTAVRELFANGINHLDADKEG